MKKLTGILGVAVFAMAMFFSINTMNSANGDLDLASLLTINKANAEDGCNDCEYFCVDADDQSCYITGIDTNSITCWDMTYN